MQINLYLPQIETVLSLKAYYLTLLRAHDVFNYIFYCFRNPEKCKILS